MFLKVAVILAALCILVTLGGCIGLYEWGAMTLVVGITNAELAIALAVGTVMCLLLSVSSEDKTRESSHMR